MATVASVPTPSVQASAAPIQQVDVRAPAEAFGPTVAGEGAEKLGATAEGVSNALAQRALELQGLQNKAHADDASSTFQVGSYGALDQFREELPAKIAAGGNPLELATAFGTDMESQRQAAATKLGNPMAQDMFNADSRRVQAYIVSQANSAAITGQKDFIVKSNQSAITAQQQLIAGSFNDPDAIESSRQSIAQHNMALGLTTGMTPEQELLATQQDVSKPLRVAIAHTAGSDAVAASKMTEDYAAKGYLTPEDAQQLRGALLNPMKAQGAAQIANSLLSSVPSPGAGGAIPTPDVVAKDFPGSTLTSGLRSPEHNAEVGGVANSYHLQGTAAAPGAMDLVPAKTMSMDDFATNLALQYPGTKIINEGDHVHIQPTAHSNAIASGSASANPITSLEARLPALMAQADTQAASFAAAHGIDPDEMKQATLAKVEESYNKVKFAYTGQNAATQSNLLTLIDGGPDGSGAKLSSLDQLLAFPGAIDQYKTLQPQQQEALQRQFNANANDPTLPRQQNHALLYGKMTAADPSDFMNTDLSRVDLTRSDLKYFNDQKIKMANETPVAMDRETKAALSGTAPGGLAVARMYAADSKGWAPDGTKYQMFVGALHGEIEAWHSAHEGAKMSDKDYNTVVANIFANGTKWAGVPNDPLSQDLTTNYKANNKGQTPTPSALADAYYRALETRRAQQH